MVEYKCERCMCVFNKKSNFMRHQNRKNICKPINVHQIENDNVNILMDKIKHMEQQMKKMEKDTSEMKKKIKSQHKTINMQNKTINKYEKCNVDNSTNVMNVIAFGKEDLSFISDAKYKHIMNRGFAAPSALAEHVHYNKDRPEYHNIYVSNKKDKKYIHVYDGNKWVIRLTKDVIEELKINASELIKSKMKLLDPNNKQDAGILKKIKRFVDSYDNDDEDLNNFDEHFELMFYNNREMVKQTHSL